MDLVAWLGFEQTHTPQHVIFLRLVFSALIGAAIGFERGSKTGSAGLRTHMLIAVAATLFTLLTLEIHAAAVAAGSQGTDPIRAVEAVTAGIAFLGAGAIFQTRGTVQGLTTAAGMWLAGATGVSIALGYYIIALGVAVLAIVVLAALRRLSHDAAADKPDMS